MENEEKNMDVSSNENVSNPVNIDETEKEESVSVDEIPNVTEVSNPVSIDDNKEEVTQESESTTNGESALNEEVVQENVSAVSEDVTTISGNDSKEKKKGNSVLTIVLVVILIAVIVAACIFLLPNLTNKGGNNGGGTVVIKDSGVKLDYKITSNKLEAFDLYFLKLANEKDINKNIVFSPLSIKYALEMVEAGADGNTKQQLDDILGSYKARKYTNSSNMAFSNILYKNDNNEKGVEDSYINKINTQFGAEVKYDSFMNSDNINNYVSNKTFNLITDIVDEINSNMNFILINALAIDMDWVNVIQSENEDYLFSYEHENAYVAVGSLTSVDYTELNFNDKIKNAKSAKIAATANKYDIVKDKGIETIKATVQKAYDQWDNNCKTKNIDCNNELYKNFSMDTYVEELKSNYGKVSSSTDFEFYVDNDVKVFAKDLKTYNDTTLQYVGIMPTIGVNTFIKELTADKANEIIGKIKPIELNSFKDGYVTIIEGYIPLFKFDYKLDLKDDLKTLGVTDLFESGKANLSGISKQENTYIEDTTHKSTIEFSNTGIKAAAATSVIAGGAGSDEMYKFEVPIERINLTFDKPYIFFVRDKATGEVWFTGVVNEPLTYTATNGR